MFDSADDSVSQLTSEYKNTTNDGHLEVVSNNLKMSFIEAVRNNSKTEGVLLLISQFLPIPFGSYVRCRIVKDNLNESNIFPSSSESKERKIA